jgi:DNA-binding XRE family transcriptional regulator
MVLTAIVACAPKSLGFGARRPGVVAPRAPLIGSRESLSKLGLRVKVPRGEMNSDINNADRQALGRALRELRRQAGITQKEMTEREGLDETYISRVEHGRIDVKWTTLLRFLRVIGADLHQLADAIAEVETQDRAAKQ